MKYEKLRKLIDHHNQLRFPDHPDHNKLSEWIIDLSEFDGYYLGIATSALNDKLFKKINFDDFNKMTERLNSIVVDSDEDKRIFNTCMNYMDSIHQIISEVNEIHKYD